MRFAVCTTYARRHWESHAKRCVETFRKHWPESVPLLQYDDAALEERSSWLPAFKQRHRGRPTVNFKFDAVRFAHKIAAIELAAKGAIESGAGVLIWMDADCITHAPVTTIWLTHLLGEGDFAYLSRAPRKYPECGFMMFRLDERGLAFIRAIVREYETDGLFAMAEWHDSWVIDIVRERFERMGKLRCVSLSGAGSRTPHPLVNGPLGAKLDHLKGSRKSEGRSREADLRVRRAEPYWTGKKDTDVTERYAQLEAIIRADKAVTSIVEVGVHRGLRAARMLEAALSSHKHRVTYKGYDVFETRDKAFHEAAMNGKGIAAQQEAASRLRDVARRLGARGRTDCTLVVGDTRDTLHGRAVDPDVAFIDGDHRLECIRGDYDALRGARIVVFDDYYIAGADGEPTPIDLDRFGCNRLVDELAAVEGVSVQLLDKVADPCKHGGRIVLAVVRRN